MVEILFTALVATAECTLYYFLRKEYNEIDKNINKS